MPALTSISQLNLAPTPGKTYFDFDREWREEFVYSLLVDLFHDDSNGATNVTANRHRLCFQVASMPETSWDLRRW
jgi:hypothetical protein